MNQKRRHPADEAFHARQVVVAACICGARSNTPLSVPAARQWHRDHANQHHPDWPDDQQAARTRRKAMRGTKTRISSPSYYHRRDQQDHDEIARRELMRYKPGVEPL